MGDSVSIKQDCNIMKKKQSEIKSEYLYIKNIKAKNLKNQESISKRQTEGK